MAIANKYLEANFSLIGEEYRDSIEIVEVFKYLRWLLDDWTTTGQRSSGTLGRRGRCRAVLGRCYGGRGVNRTYW